MPDKFDFTCPNGHKFSAIAKRLSRCPQCGVATRRDFRAQAPQSSQSGSTTSTTSPHSFSKAASRKDTGSGSNSGSTTVKGSGQGSETGKTVSKSSPTSTTSTSKKPQIVKQGLPNMPRTVKKPPIPTKATTALKKTSSPVRNVTAKRGHTPSVTKPPTGSKERKVIEQTTNEPYWRKVQRSFGITR